MNDCGEWVMEGMDDREQMAEGRTAPWPIKAPLWAPMTIDAHVNEHTQIVVSGYVGHLKLELREFGCMKWECSVLSVLSIKMWNDICLNIFVQKQSTRLDITLSKRSDYESHVEAC